MKKKLMNKQIRKLLEHCKQISLLGKVSALAHWDLEVNLPPKASEERAAQLAYLTSIRTDLWLAKDFRSIIEDVDVSKLDQKEKAIVRNLRDSAKFYYKVPKEIIIKEVETTSKAFMAWKKAKEENNFKDFLPHLKQIIDLDLIIANHLGYKKNPYDALLDLYEPGLTAEFCGKIFNGLQPELTTLIKQIQKTKRFKNKSGLVGGDKNYPEQDQKQIALYVLRKMGYDLDAGRLDTAPHPFETKLGRHDIRITTHYHVNDFLDSLMGVMHEAGHAMYEQGVSEEYTNTPLQGGVSLGIHESQSRFWENQVGRSMEFVKFIAPVFQAFYAGQLGKTSTEELFAAVNDVRPGLIRVEADEVTYNLHVVLRFEIENALMNKKIKPDDLPEIWRTKMKKYLGIVPATDREGVLQDIHWSHGSFGYFPTYTLGNLYAAQFAAAMRKKLVIEDLVEKGEFGTILSWLRSNIHQYGSLYWPDELVKKVTGHALSPKHFLKYIREKYSQIYEL